MGVGILISSYPRGQSKKLKFHGGRNFDIILSLWTVQANLKFHGGGNFGIILSLRTVQANLKFHGGGNFDIT